MEQLWSDSVVGQQETGGGVSQPSRVWPPVPDGAAGRPCARAGETGGRGLRAPLNWERDSSTARQLDSSTARQLDS
ncbi:MAG: hypothetical protein OXH83_00445, partial [Bryobacterales bacterium]|nr:hypothetical protein [Bryobacterales bacterium]